ncbi:hypothetical protein E1460_23515 [Salmonella enterica subsp. enterica serovar Caracas]|nr:hypothetical protein [Salmonella enterica subsp. enterica serovar Caracas]
MQTSRILMVLFMLVSGVMTLPVLATDEDIPEVLRYARKYSHANPENLKPYMSKRKETGLAADMGTGLARKLARSELIRRQQHLQLKESEKKIMTLEKEKSSLRLSTENTSRLQNNVQALESQIKGLKRDLASAIESQVALTKKLNNLKQEKDELQKASDIALNAQRVVQKKAEATFHSKNEALSRELETAAEKLAALTKQISNLQQEKATLLANAQKEKQAHQESLQKTEAILQTKATELSMVRQQADSLASEKITLEKKLQTLRKQKKKEQVEAEILLNTASQLQAYAAGVMYARDIQEALDGNRLLGLNLDSSVLIAGINDVLTGKTLRLEEKSLTTASDDLVKSANAGFLRVTTEQKTKAEAWLKTFRKGKGVAKDDLGFWFQVTYEGDGAHLKPEYLVDVVVEESLPDGKVVSDMELTGNALRQKVQEFPPVFAAGLLRLKNHGQITLVVPPELAYGDKGYPPHVPPGATMIYRVRVADVIAEK